MRDFANARLVLLPVDSSSVSTMSTFNSLSTLDIDDLRQLTVVKLKDILREHNESVTGNKSVLVARCFSLKTKLSLNSRSDDDDKSDDVAAFDPFKALDTDAEITFEQLNLSAKDRIWSGDLRKMVEFNFHQLHEYLVLRTLKYDDQVMKGSCYKKLKSYQFFMEGHVSNVEVAAGHGYTWIKSKVLASMKKAKYRVLIVFHNTGDVKFAACECPAG